MAEPFIVVVTHGVKQGKEQAYKRHLAQFAEVIEREEPRLLAFNLYLSEDGREAAAVQVHPDADSMLTHLRVLSGVIAEHYDFVEPGSDRLDVYGTPTPALVAALGEMGGDTPVTVRSVFAGGFTRLAERVTA